MHYGSKSSEKINTYYVILVKQYALYSDQFEFLTNLKKTIEQLGTLFEAQSAQLASNINLYTQSTGNRSGLSPYLHYAT